MAERAAVLAVLDLTVRWVGAELDGVDDAGDLGLVITRAGLGAGQRLDRLHQGDPATAERTGGLQGGGEVFGAQPLREILGEALGESADLEKIVPHGRGFRLRLDLGEHRRDGLVGFTRGVDGQRGQGVTTDGRRTGFGGQAAERVERSLLSDGAKGGDGSLAERGFFFAAGEVADLRDELDELPLAGETDAFDEQFRFGLIVQQRAEPGQVAVRADVAGAGVSQGAGDALTGAGLQRRVVDQRLVEQAGFFGRARLADEFDPRTRAGGVDLTSDEETLHVRRGDAGVDRLHDRVERGFLAFDLGGLGGDVFEPRTGEFVDARPGGEIEEGVLGVLRKVREHGAGALRGADAGEGAMGFELDARIGVGEERREQADVRRAAGAEGLAEFAEADLEAHRVLALQEHGEVGRIGGASAQEPGGVATRDIILGPILEGGLELGDGEFGEFAAGLFEIPAVRGKEAGEELRRRLAEDRLPGQRLGRLGQDAPDAAADLVATRVAEVDLAVVDDRVGPVSDVKGAVRSHLRGDRAEGDVAGTDDVGQFLGHVAGLR